MIRALVVIPILLAGVYLVALAAVAVASPATVRRYLGSFAQSFGVHAAELLVRIIVGASLIAHAPQMRFSALCAGFGWLLVGTSVVLALMPWRWHQRFAAWSVPMATGQLTLLAAGSLAAGVFILVSLVPVGP